MTIFRWIHLSDFHIKTKPSYAKEILFEQLLEDIKGQCRSSGEIDAILFSGDLCFSGDENEYVRAEKYLDNVLEACGLSGQRNKIFFVPGNHDVYRKKVYDDIKFIRDRVLDRVEEHYDQIDNCLIDMSVRLRFFERFSNFENFIDSYYSSFDTSYYNEPSSYFFTTNILKNGNSISILGLNSTWLSQEDNEQGRLFIGRIQANEAKTALTEKFPKSNFRITLLHHPLYWLAEKDLSIVEPLISKTSSVILHGHLHTPRMYIHQDPDTDIHVLAAGSGFESRSKVNAYNIVEVNLVNGDAIVKTRFQHPEYSPNWGPDILTYNNSRDGSLSLKVKIW